MSPKPQVIGILGAGRVGTALARLAIAAGYDVRIATSRSPEEIALLVEIITPGATPGAAADVIAASDIVVLALPLSKYRALVPEQLACKVVIDPMNYWAPTDGVMPEFETEQSSSEIVQAYLPKARLVRSFNHMGYHEIEQEARPTGDASRRALAIAGNDAEARRSVAEFIDRLGYDSVDAGDLASSRKFGTGTAIFGGGFTANELAERLNREMETASET